MIRHTKKQRLLFFIYRYVLLAEVPGVARVTTKNLEFWRKNDFLKEKIISNLLAYVTPGSHGFPKKIHPNYKSEELYFI